MKSSKSKSSREKSIWGILANVKTFAIFFLMLVLIDLLFFINVNTNVDIDIVYVIAVNLVLSMIFLSILSLFRKVGIIISCIIIFFILLFSIVEIAIYGTYMSFMPFKTIFFQTNGVISQYGKEFFDVAYHNALLVAVSVIIYIAFIVLLHKNSNLSLLFDRKIAIITLVISYTSLIVMNIFTISNADFTFNVSCFGIKSAVISDVYRPKEYIKYDSSETATDKDINFYKNNNVLTIDSILKKETNDDTLNDVNKYVSIITPTEKNRYTGIFKGKNLILICAEAYSHYIVDPILTPTLYRLTYNGFRFNDFYVPSWGGSTTTGELAFLTGLIPYSPSCSMKDTIGIDMRFTMPNVLKKEGYKTGAYHNGNFKYYDRNLTHTENLGFDYYLACGNGIEDITGPWPTDQKMINETYKKYRDGTPFCIYYMTVSGHAFYNDRGSFKVIKSINKVKERYGDKYPEQVENYICYQMYLEDALTELIDNLTKDNMLDDTVICMVADHFPYGLSSDAFTDGSNFLPYLYEDSDIDTFEIDKNMPILWCGALENKYKDIEKDINEPTSTVDLLPTLLNLFGVKYDSRLLPGRDVMSHTEPMVVYNNGAFINAKGKYVLHRQKFIPNPDIIVDKTDIEINKEIAKSKILFSKYITLKNYYNYLFGKED